MSFGSNNSRNVANLLKYQPLAPIQTRKPSQIPVNEIPNLKRTQIPIDEVFTPQQGLANRSIKRRTPLSSGGNHPEFLQQKNEDDAQLQSFRVRLQQIVRYYDQRHNHLESKIMVRLNELQNFVMKEVPKIDNNTMISSDIASFKEVIKDIRRSQEHQSQQINTIKVILNQKNNQNSSANKDKEKMTILFMELVRLGDTIQKVTTGVNETARNYQGRMLELQTKLSMSERNLAILAQKNNTGSEVISELGDKLLNRLQTAESNLLILGKQQVKDKELISRLSSQNQRMGEDLQSLLKNIQGDFQNKLQNRISQTINRLMFEHQERVKAQEQIRKNLDLRQRINQQKQMSDKIQNKARYQNMDVRNQFLKKQESIRALTAAMEEQFRNTMKQIQVEGNKRKQQQILFRTQIKRIQQNFRKQYDIYKNHQSDLVEKITDMIKAQIQVRLSSELDLKKLTSDIANELVTDLNNLKQTITHNNKKLNLSIKEIANQSSQRSAQLSHYIDDQIKKLTEVVTEKYSKMKNVFTKLAQQFKSHLLNTEVNRKNVQNRLNIVQQDFNKLKNQVNVQIQDFYNDLESRLKEQKQYVETFVFKKNNDLTIRVNKLQEYTNKYFELLKNGMEDNKQLIANKLKTNSDSGSNQNDEEIKQLRTFIFNMKQLTEQLKQQNENTFRQIKRELQNQQNNSKESYIELKNQFQEKIKKTENKNIQLQQNLNQITTKVNALRVDNGSGNAISNERLKKLSDEIDGLVQKIKDVEQKNSNICNQNQEEIVKLGVDIKTLKAQIGALEDQLKKIAQK